MQQSVIPSIQATPAPLPPTQQATSLPDYIYVVPVPPVASVATVTPLSESFNEVDKLTNPPIYIQNLQVVSKKRLIFP